MKDWNIMVHSKMAELLAQVARYDCDDADVCYWWDKLDDLADESGDYVDAFKQLLDRLIERSEDNE